MTKLLKLCHWFTPILIFSFILLRLVWINYLPPSIFIDEYNLAIQAAQITLNQLSIHWLSYGWYGTPALFFYYLTIFFKVFGISIMSFKLAWLIPGVLTLPVLYYLSSLIFKQKKIALVSLTLLGLNLISIHISRWGHGPVIIGFLHLGAITALWKAHENKLTLATIWTIIAITLSSLSLYFYVGARSFYFMLPLFSVWLWINSKMMFKNKVRLLLIFFITYFLGLIPFILSLKENQFQTLWRIQEVSIIDYHSSILTNLNSVLGNFSQYIRIFFDSIDHNLRHNPLQTRIFPWFIGILVPIGIGLGMIDGLYRKQTLFLFFALLSLSMGGIMSVEAPSYFRVFGALPIMILVITQSLVIMYRWFEKVVSSDRTRQVIVKILILLIILSHLPNLYSYFFVLRNNPKAVAVAFTKKEDRIGILANLLYQNGEFVVLDKDFLYSSTFFHALPDDAHNIFSIFEIDTLLDEQEMRIYILEKESLGLHSFFSDFFNIHDYYPILVNNLNSALVWKISPKKIIPNVYGLWMSCSTEDGLVKSGRSLGIYHNFAYLPDSFNKCVWYGQLVIESDGKYSFRGRADDYLTVKLVDQDDRIVLETHDEPTWVKEVYLQKGVYNISSSYYNYGGAKFAQLDWRTPNSDDFIMIDPRHWRVVTRIEDNNYVE